MYLKFQFFEIIASLKAVLININDEIAAIETDSKVVIEPINVTKHLIIPLIFIKV